MMRILWADDRGQNLWWSSKPFELNIKRCYLPFQLTSVCPRCGTSETHQQGDPGQDVGFPVVNTEDTEGLWSNCRECDHDWEVLRYRLRLELVVDDDE